MQEREVEEYPDALIKATTGMLGNSRLLSMFMKLIFKKTNVYEPSKVIVTCETIVKWFEKVYITKSFPSNFDFPFFFKGVCIMLTLDHALITSKCLWMIYKIFHILPVEERLRLVEFIDSIFLKLMFHWAWNIRNVFSIFLMY